MNREIKVFNNIAGYEAVKKELLTILDWYNNRDESQKLGLKLPRGVIFYGNVGCGKTLFMREYSKMFNLPILTVVGDSDNLEDEITDIFAKAREEKCVVLIDELDLLLDDNKHIIRILQTEMDGINEDCSPFIIATCNNIRAVPPALRRSGRFDRLIEISNPNKKYRKELFEMYLKKINCSLNDDELSYIADICSCVCCSDIARIINDCYLRFDGDINIENIEASYYILYNGLSEDYSKVEDYKMTALHEAGHALIAYKNKKYFNFYRATIEAANGHSGMCKIYDVNENDSSLDKMVASIEISLGGYLATKIIANYMGTGANSDLKNANYNMRCLVNSLGYYKGIRNILREWSDFGRNETVFSSYRNEKIVRKLLIKIEKRVSIFIKRNKAKLINLSNYLYENGTMNQTEFNKIVAM